MKEVYLASEIQIDSIVDGPGLRAVVWFQGCKHDCKGCHNPETQTMNVGIKKTVDEICNEICLLENQNGITFSGGDPMFQPEALLEILKYTKSLGYNIWCYTGFVYEALLKKTEVYRGILKYIDVLIDGRFELDKKTFECKFRGSYNQRLIDVQKSLQEEKVVLYND